MPMQNIISQTRSHLIKDRSAIDLSAFFPEWNWLLKNHQNIILVSAAGDVFFENSHGEIHWLDTSVGEINKVADSEKQFAELLSDETNLDTWFLSSLVEELIAKDVKL